MNYLDKYNLIYNGEKDLAYYAYEKIIFKHVPRLIEYALEHKLMNVVFYIKFATKETGLSGTTSDVYLRVGNKTELLGMRLNRDDLKNYIYQLNCKFNENSYITIEPIKDKFNEEEIKIFAPLKDLINFYYEELQRDQYYTKMTR